MTEDTSQIVQVPVVEEVSPDPVVPTPPAPPELRILQTADEILATDDLATEVVPVPEWGGAVIVRALAGTERDKYESEIFQLSGSGKDRTVDYNMDNLRARLSARTIVNDQGQRVFTDAQITKLGLKSAAALDRVFTVAQRLSRLTSEDVKELAAQLGNGQSGSSGSA